MRRPLAIFSSLPPSKSGIADYCVEQLPHWGDQWSLTVVIGNEQDEPTEVPEGISVVRLDEWLSDKVRDSRTPRLYHIGNNLHHEFVFEQALQRPGIVVLHDFVLHHLIVEMTLARENRERYAWFMEYDHGAVGRRMASQRQQFIFSSFQQFLLALNGPILDKAQAVIVHSHWAARRIAERCPSKPVTCIPHHYSPPPKDVLDEGRGYSRSIIGMPDDKLLFASIGFVTEPKKIDLTIRALGAIRDRLPPFEFWLAGEAQDRRGLIKRATDCGLGECVHLTGYLPIDRFHHVIQASDVIVNLRYPTAGESSGTLVRALGMGRCCVVFDYASFGEYPDDVAVKIPLRTDDITALRDALLRVGADAAYRRSYETRAREYIAQTARIETCVARYGRFLEQYMSSVAS